MNVLFVSGHPAHVHNFKLVKNELEERGHNVYWLAKDKEVSRQLLQTYKINYELLKKPGKSIISKIYVFIGNTLFSINYLKKNNIDVVVSRLSPYLAIASYIMRKSHITLTDTETAGFYDRIFSKFVSVVLTSYSFKNNIHPKQIRYNANTELFYLHPNRFNNTDNIENILGINTKTPFVLMRFVSWNAYHDKGLSGFSDANKIKVVEMFSKYARIFISSEKDLPPQLEKYRVQISPDKIHYVIKNAALLFGESATMASESAVLGTPAIYLNKNWLGYIEEEADYGLVFTFKDSEEDQKNAINKGVELLNDPSVKEKIKKSRFKFIENKIDVTAFLAWFIEKYPVSQRRMENDPDYQYNFK